MKRTDLAKADAKKLQHQAGPRALPSGTAGAQQPDRREQRERDRALGLVPFAVKLNGDLVKQLQVLAQERGLDMNALVAEVLQKGLAD
jgi:hypothetical protein